MVLRTANMLCLCCMRKHAVQTIRVRSHNTFQNVDLEYEEEYYYCDRADEGYADEDQVKANDIAMKNAYRKKVGLLTSHQIASVRAKYGISQNDLCLLLGWDANTITRYESHQVQDIAHDAILRRLDSDPEWFLQLLHARKGLFQRGAFTKYLTSADSILEQKHGMHLKNAVVSE